MGRKTTPDPLLTVSIRLSKQHKQIFIALGGAKWLRNKLAENELTYQSKSPTP